MGWRQTSERKPVQAQSTSFETEKESFVRFQNTTFQFEGTSDSAACRDAVLSLFAFNASCGAATDECTFNGVYQPHVYGKYMVGGSD